MEFIWHILLTVCLGSDCKTQDVQWFKDEKECNTMLILYKEIPPDGEWDTIEYVCKPVGSKSA
jgi:hypothetical protein|tara:strand:+ start:394 stop:582 length:189 start_codon:yes stop_codon:yes gene_type:complete